MPILNKPIFNAGFRILPWSTSRRSGTGIEISPQLVEAALKNGDEVF